MKCLTRCSLLFCCFLLSFIICSVPVSAESVSLLNYTVTQSFEVWNESASWSGESFTFEPYNGTAESNEFEHTSNYVVPATLSDYTITTHYKFSSKSGAILAESGKETTFNISKVALKYLLSVSTNFEYVRNVNLVRGLLWYADGTFQYVDDITKHQLDTLDWNFSFTYTPDKEVQHIELICTTEGTSPNTKRNWQLTSYPGETLGDETFTVTIGAPSEEAGLLEGIGDTLTSGFAAIGDWFSDLGSDLTSGFESLGNGISDVFDAITNLPAKIWEFIENGLKSLFVPDEEYMAGYKQKWEDLLADRLGAVYQVVQITFGAWEDIETADQINTINIPVVTIPLLDNQEFSFGGYDVKIVPDGFDILVTALKSIVGIVCTIMFINGLRKRYDEIMGVEQ